MRLAIALVVVGRVAVAQPRQSLPPMGEYRMQRDSRGSAVRTTKGKKDKRIADCTYSDGIPIPTILVITVSASPIIVVNKEKWDEGGLTTDRDGKASTQSRRIANKPNTPPGKYISVSFRADGDEASGSFMILESDNDRECVTVYHFSGSFTP